MVSVGDDAAVRLPHPEHISKVYASVGIRLTLEEVDHFE